MFVLIQKYNVAYEGEWTTLRGVFTDDLLALQALEDLKTLLKKEEKIDIDEWKKEINRIGYIIEDGGCTNHIFLQEVELNKLI